MKERKKRKTEMTVLITFSQEMDMFSLSEPNNT